MRLLRLGPLSVFCLLLSVTTIQGQQTSTSATSVRDPQALSILTQCLAAAGGAQAISAIQDFTGTGNITYFWAGNQVQGPVTVRGLGTTHFRLDANLPDGQRSWSVRNGQGALHAADGTSTQIPYSNAMNMGSLTFPYGQVLAAINDSTESVTLLGLQNSGVHKVYRITVQRDFDTEDDPHGILTAFSKRTFSVDSETFQVVSITDFTHSVHDANNESIHEVRFADYRTSNGIIAPFSVTEMISDQVTWKIQLDDLKFNQNLTDSDFSL